MSSITNIPVDIIETDPDLQMRDGGVDAGIVVEYAEAMSAGAAFPPVVVYIDRDAYWLADGFHRVEAARKAGLTEIAAEVRQGSRRDAMLAAAGVNAFHGLRRTAADKRRAVLALLRDPDWSKWSDRKIAEQCAVGNKFVGDVRRSIVTVAGHSERTYVTKHGTVATMKVAARSSDEPKPAGSLVVQMLMQATDEALIAECRRRNFEVVK